MSVWSDIGVVDDHLNAVNPCAFLNAAYGFFKGMRYQIAVITHAMPTLPDYDFLFRRKSNPRALRPDAFSCPMEPDMLGRPIPENYWNTLPQWGEIFAQTEETLLGEDIVPFPYSRTGNSIMSPEWPLQRYKIIQKMRYMTVPVELRAKEYGKWIDYSHRWDIYDSYRPITEYGMNTDKFWWRKSGQYSQLEAQIPEYWSKGNTVCKIGYIGRWALPDDPNPPPPINGCAWSGGSLYLTEEYMGTYSGRAVIQLYGAVDLATHPDFAQYFDMNEKEEQ